MAGLLDALLANESGGRNVANVDQGTSSGQAQGYFQITTGTWNDFGGRRFAPNPLQASYEQQAEIASRIPLRRWDESTVAKMRATGKPVDPNRTLGENLAAAGESFSGAVASTGPDGPKGQEMYTSTAAPPPQELSVASLLEDAVAPTDDAVAPMSFNRSNGAAGGLSLPGRASSGEQSASRGGLGDGGQVPTVDLDFASAAPELLPVPPTTAALTAPPAGGLAELFKVGDIGLAADSAIDPATGQRLLGRARRTFA